MTISLRLGHIEIFVADPILSAVFWRSTLGFRIIDVQSSEFVWIDCGGPEVLLRAGRPARTATTYQQAAHGLVLYTDDLDATAARLAAAGVIVEGNDGSDRCLTFRDPDGNWFQLTQEERVKGERRDNCE